MHEKLLIRWLQVVCVLTGVVGLAATGGSYTGTEEPWRFLFDVLTWPVDGQPGTFSRETAAVNAVAGSVMVGWATLMFAVVTGPVAQGDRRMTDAMLASVLCWFFLDSLGSLAAVLPGNILLNAIFVMLFGLPLGVLRSRQANPSDP